MFVKIELVDTSYGDYLINTDIITRVYHQNDDFVVETNTQAHLITEDSFHRLVGFLFREKKNVDKPIHISVGNQRKPYRRTRYYHNNEDNNNTED